MIDHVILNVDDLGTSRSFYEKALEPLRMTVVMEFPNRCAFGSEGNPVFWVAGRGRPATGVHVALAAPDRASVDRFYEAAVAAGGRDNGPPGLREHYHPTYYGAFVLDPDGNNIEAVTHRPE